MARSDALETIGFSGTLQQSVLRCRICGTFWQTTDRGGLTPISAARVELARSGRPMVPEG
ncbi:hypothetical protein [Mesorhizobium japonicum]|uniref:hypothetical protein n=1 Tax=Mesorhizobium japonicum TaxID=2066070 RepID=UPI003B5A23B5